MNLSRIVKTTMMSLPLAFLIGCGGGGGGGDSQTPASPKTLTGVLVDSAVSGVKYNCSSGSSGVTNTAGEFTCNVGDTVAFSIGGVALGSVAVGEIITPGTFFPGNDVAALNFAQLLQTLDTDGDPSNGISLDKNVLSDFKTQVNSAEINFTKDEFDANIQTILDKLDKPKTLVSNDAARNHLKDTLVTLGINPDGSQDTTAPTFTTINHFDVSENQVVVGNIATDDEDATLSLGGDNSSAFNLNDGNLTFVDAPDFETKSTYSLQIIATDTSANQSTQTITVTILDVDEIAPVFKSTNTPSVNENATSVLTIETDESTTLSLDGDDASLFALNAGVLSFNEAKDFEVDKHQYSVTITATDDASNSSTQTLTITLVDVDEVVIDETPPTITSADNFSVYENQTTVGGITTNEVATLNLSGTDADAFTVVEGVLKFKSLPDYEKQNTYSLVVTATDSSDNNSSQNISVNLLDEKEVYISYDSGNGNKPYIYNLDKEEIALLKDINPNGASGPVFGPTIGNKTYFSAEDETHGRELFVTDGTEEGTLMLKDICQVEDATSGKSHSYVSHMINIGETLYFRATDGVHGDELYKSDGTPDGTVMVKDIYPNDTQNPSYHLTSLLNFNDTLYFTADDGSHGSELWKSDGTADGTVMVKDIYEGTNTSNPGYFAILNDSLYFRASDGVSGFELYKTNGTPEGTVLVQDIYAGSSNSYVNSIENINNTLYFSADDGIHGEELLKSDGTNNGAELVKDIYEGSDASNIYDVTKVGDKIFFTADSHIASTDEESHDLFVSNGTTSGTISLAGLDQFDDVNIKDGAKTLLYYTTHTFRIVDNQEVHTYSLWRSNGTPEGTFLLKEYTNENFLIVAIIDDHILYREDLSHKLYVSDGTVEGIKLLYNPNL